MQLPHLRSDAGVIAPPGALLPPPVPGQGVHRSAAWRPGRLAGCCLPLSSCLRCPLRSALSLVDAAMGCCHSSGVCCYHLFLKGGFLLLVARGAGDIRGGMMMACQSSRPAAARPATAACPTSHRRRQQRPRMQTQGRPRWVLWWPARTAAACSALTATRTSTRRCTTAPAASAPALTTRVQQRAMPPGGMQTALRP